MQNFLNNIASRALEDWKQPGLAIAVVHDDQTYIEGFGTRNSSEYASVDGDTVFALASCTKPFAATVTLLLQHEGALSLDDHVIKYLPDFKLSDKQATNDIKIRDLLCNRLGLLSSEGRHRQVANSRDDLIYRMQHQPFRHTFREAYGYCTDAFTVLGAVLEAASGLTWTELVRTRIFLPLQMGRTNTCHVEAQKALNWAVPHLHDGEKYMPIEWVYEDTVAAPAGGINSSASDMSHWLSFLLNGRALGGSVLLPVDVLAQAHVQHTPDRGPFAEAELSQAMGEGKNLVTREAYALGWYSHWYKGQNILYHTGSIDGFRSVVGIIPSLKFGAAILCNADNPFLGRMLFQSLVDKALGDETLDWSAVFMQHQSEVGQGKKLLKGVSTDLNSDQIVQLKPLCGRYFDKTGFGEGEVFVDGRKLILSVGTLCFELVPLSVKKFKAYKIWPFITRPQFSAEIHTDEAGCITGFSTSQEAYFSRK